MLIVVADTGPLNYLVLIGQVDRLPDLFESVYVPDAVEAELAALGAPKLVRDWIATPPPWLVVTPAPAATLSLGKLDAGEQAALALAVQLKAELILIDDRAGVRAALAQGLLAMGTLGILDRAAAVGLVDLRSALARLAKTNFHIRQPIIDALLARRSIDQ